MQAWDWANEALAEDWQFSLEFDRYFWGTTVALYSAFTLKAAPQMSAAENVENFTICAVILAMALISTLYAAAWRRHTPLLRVVLLFYIYSLPILTSVDAMHAISPAPSKVRYIGGILDAVALWLSTSNGFIAWSLLAARPPLFVALPAQIFVLARITAGNMCRTPILQHPIMQRRTERDHRILSHLPCVFGLHPLKLMIPITPDARCWALLLFYNVLLGLLLPLLLIVPLRQQGQPASGDGADSIAAHASSGRRKGLLGRLDSYIDACLRSLLWPRAADERVTALFGWLARWLLLLTLLWMGCCLLAEPT
ncbi:permease urea carboxylase system [Chlorella sorokiniana]|uniref:Permease urea carboxylase system n=1 Tax=Chlorella sorokiniana TaxID=3076 RepID=A0A2P6TKZ3_CHLSO|nr:permease urea carboxylase system [Chlorella sorokiniana]|eukprot:PRW44962.1 permease urea carboxylase system [Chlorella sorokiniana]